MNMKTKINISDLRNRIKLYPITGYNNTQNGTPGHTYNSTYTDVWCKAVLSTELSDSEDKNHTIQKYTLTVRKDEIVYKLEDKIVLNNRTIYIKEIKEIDIWYQSLTCTEQH